MSSRKYLSNKLLPECHTNLYTTIKNLLQKCAQVSLTLDIWSNRQIRSYVGVACHFIVDFQLYSVMLAWRRFIGSHAAEAIVTNFEEIVNAFDLRGKVLNVVTDNASNMKKAFCLISKSTSVDDDDDDVDFDDDVIL